VVILSHRGYWEREEEKNTLGAFKRSFDCGFGVEIDVRDYCGGVVISHDVADADALKFEEFLDLYSGFNGLTLAINIKSDGLQTLLGDLLKKYQVEDYFVFDMSVPDGLEYIKLGMNVFTRESEFESSPAFYEQSCGVWMDCFEREWFGEDEIRQHLSRGKKVCVVSGELHSRQHLPFWQELVKLTVVDDERLMICTDYPQQARRVFDGKD